MSLQQAFNELNDSVKELEKLVNSDPMELLKQKEYQAQCTKCGEQVLGEEDGLCGACSGEAPSEEI